MLASRRTRCGRLSGRDGEGHRLLEPLLQIPTTSRLAGSGSIRTSRRSVGTRASRG